MKVKGSLELALEMWKEKEICLTKFELYTSGSCARDTMVLGLLERYSAEDYDCKKKNLKAFLL